MLMLMTFLFFSFRSLSLADYIDPLRLSARVDDLPYFTLPLLSSAGCVLGAGIVTLFPLPHHRRKILIVLLFSLFMFMLFFSFFLFSLACSKSDKNGWLFVFFSSILLFPFNFLLLFLFASSFCLRFGASYDMVI